MACNYCTLRNVSVIAFNPLGNLTIDYKWVSIYGQYPIYNYDNYTFELILRKNNLLWFFVRYNTVEKCLFQDKNHMGTTVVVWRTGNKIFLNNLLWFHLIFLLSEGVEDHHLISQNIFLRRVTHFNLNGQEAIRIGTSSTQGPSYTIVEYNQ